jgi:hypothetical protein
MRPRLTGATSDRIQLYMTTVNHDVLLPKYLFTSFCPPSSGCLNFLGLNCTFCVIFYVNRETISTFPSKSFVPFPFPNGSWLVHGVTKQKISTLLKVCVYFVTVQCGNRLRTVYFSKHQKTLDECSASISGTFSPH